MSSYIYEMNRTSGDCLAVLSQEIIDVLNDRYVEPELVIEKVEDNVLLLQFEKFYLRNGSMASLTILVIKDGDSQKATVIGSGGGSGVLNISLGANNNFATIAVKALAELGFAETK